MKEDFSLKIDMKSVEILYNPIAVNRLINFFKLHTDDEILKDLAWESVENY